MSQVSSCGEWRVATPRVCLLSGGPSDRGLWERAAPALDSGVSYMRDRAGHRY